MVLPCKSLQCLWTPMCVKLEVTPLACRADMAKERVTLAEHSSIHSIINQNSDVNTILAALQARPSCHTATRPQLWALQHCSSTTIPPHALQHRLSVWFLMMVSKPHRISLFHAGEPETWAAAHGGAQLEVIHGSALQLVQLFVPVIQNIQWHPLKKLFT